MSHHLFHKLKTVVKKDFIPLDVNIFTLYTLDKLIKNGDVFIEGDENGDSFMLAVSLIKRKMLCGNDSVFVYYGYKDERGNIHIVDNGELKHIINIIDDVNNSDDLSQIQKRRFIQMEIRIESVSSFNRNMDEVQNDLAYLIH